MLMADEYLRSRSTEVLVSYSESRKNKGVMLTLFRFATSLTKEITSQLAAESRPLVGSSKKRILGEVMS